MHIENKGALSPIYVVFSRKKTEMCSQAFLYPEVFFFLIALSDFHRFWNNSLQLLPCALLFRVGFKKKKSNPHIKRGLFICHLMASER